MEFIDKMSNRLRGKVVKEVKYLSDPDMDGMGWYKRPVVIIFTDGSFLIPQMDDEGNDGGALCYGDKDGVTTIGTT